MTPATLIRRNMTRRKTRLALSLAAIAVAFLLFGVMSAVRQNFSLGTTNENATRLVVSSKIGDFEPLPLAYVDRVRQTKGVTSTSYRVYGVASFQDPKNLFATLAVDPASYLAIYPDYVLADADRAEFVRDREAMVVGETLANRFKWKKGDVVPITQRSLSGGGDIIRKLRIAGIFHPATAEVGTGLALSSFATLNDAQPGQKDMVSSIVVRTAHPAVNDAVITAIDQSFQNSGYETRTMTEEAFSRALVSQIGDIALVTTLVIAAGFFAILLIVGSAMASSIRERSREIGVLRTLGFQSGAISRMLLAESILIALIGGTIGLMIANLIVHALRTADSATFGRMALTGSSFGIAVVLMVTFGLATVILPVRKALRTDITTTLARR